MGERFVVVVETTVEVVADSPHKARDAVRQRGGDGNPTRVGVRRPVPYAPDNVWVETVYAECEACDAYLAGEDDDGGWETDPEGGSRFCPACVARMRTEVTP